MNIIRMNRCTLAEPIATPLGTYAPGSEVTIVTKLTSKVLNMERYVVCLDPRGKHPNGNCHQVIVAEGALKGRPHHLPHEFKAGCGTQSGYDRHRHQRETPCAACKAAHASYAREQYRRQKFSTGQEDAA